MSNFIKRIISLSLAILIGFTSIGYSADLHFCKGNLKSMAFFGTAKSCHEMAMKASCHHKKESIPNSETCSDETEKDCCKNEKVTDNFEYDGVSILQEYITETVPLDLESTEYCDWFSDFNSIKSVSINDPPQKNIYPKPHGIELRVAIQSFLC